MLNMLKKYIFKNKFKNILIVNDNKKIIIQK